MDRIAGDPYDSALVVALPLTGLSLGLSSEVAGFLAPLRSLRALTTVLSLDVVAIPLGVWARTHPLCVSSHSPIGLILLGVASAALGIIASRIAGGDAKAAASWWCSKPRPLTRFPYGRPPCSCRGAIPLGQLIATLLPVVLTPLAAGVGLRA